MQANEDLEERQQRQEEATVAQRAQPQHRGLTLPPQNPDRDRLFHLSSEERRRALAIKAVVGSAEDLEDLPDLQYVQFALAFPDSNLEVALDRVRGLQAFRHEYKISDTFEEGMDLVSSFTQQHPNCLLSFAYDDESENYGLIYDRSRMDHQVLQADSNWRVFLGTAYYIFNSLCPDHHSMRRGIFLIAECEGTQSGRMSVDALQQCWYHFLYHLPIYYHSIRFFHTNTVANLSYQLMKPFMRDDVRNRITMGCQFGANLSSLYLLPTPEVATQRALERFAGFMKTRYDNQTSYSLSG